MALVRALVARPILDLTEEDLPEYFDPDVEMIALRSVTEGAYRGYAGLLRLQADNAATFEKFEQRYDVREVGERVLATGTIRVRGAGSGVEMDIPAHIVIEFRHGKISRWHAFGLKAEALNALGLTE